LNNLLAALRAMSAIAAAPSLPGNQFFRQIESMPYLDAARTNYYTDEGSQRIFDWIQQYRAIESFYGAPLPICLDNAPFRKDEWARLEKQAAAMTPKIADDYLLDRINTWLLESYALQGECEALPGDIVLDCGTYTGNTSLYFSQKVGASGHVYGFEAANATFEKYRRNMHGVKNVTPVHAAVGNVTGSLRFSGDQADARIAEEGEEVPVITIDEFCRSRCLAKVDFIKMDVEGAEDIALEGATGIIQKYRPKMAISAYHKILDVIELPKRILSIAPYTFKLRHFSDRIIETVLYCIPGAAKTCTQPLPPKQTACSRQYATLLFNVLPLMRKALLSSFTVQQHMHKALETATQGMHQLMADCERLGMENAALKRTLEKLRTKSDI
jgi:FkbM family methyltransferase